MKIVYTLALALCAGGMLAGTAQAQCQSGSEGQRAQCCHNRCYNQRLVPYDSCFNGCMGRAILQGRTGGPQSAEAKATAEACATPAAERPRGPQNIKTDAGAEGRRPSAE